MSLALVTAALKSKGFKDLAKAIVKPIGASILSNMLEKAGIDSSSDSMDEELARVINEGKKITYDFLLAQDQIRLESLKARIGDVQHARDTVFGARAKMTLEHQQWVDRMNLFESMAMSIGGICLVFFTLLSITVATTKYGVKIPEWLQMLIATTVTWLTKDLISARSNYKFSTSESSSKKNATIGEALEREQEDDTEMQRRVYAQLDTELPKPPKVIDDELLSPDLPGGVVEESIDQLISYERRR